jgi:hypothetical protein
MISKRTHTSSRRTSVALCALLGVATSLTGQKHWAYSKPTRPAIPAVKAGDWPRNPIDAFVLARLEKAGLEPARSAERARLLRRVYLDLTGLPPSIADVDTFLSDRSPDAYAKTVDRLLASPRFGEHWARHWLDLARYADSNGFQADQLRQSWAYRDWVINALNTGMPFDQFTIEQIAGDMLAQATLSQKVATGFHRTVVCNVEAGVHPESNRVDQVVDRVNTTATVWLGSTIACSQCHDHKYDPFSQKEYYQLFSFFNNTPIEVKNPLGKGVSFDFYGPKIDLPLLPKQAAARAKLESRLADAERRHAVAVKNAASRQPAWERRIAAALASGSKWHVLDVAKFESTGDEDSEILPDKSVLIGGRVPGTATYTVTINTELTNITAFKLETLTHPSLPGTGPGRGDDARPNFILSEFAVKARSADDKTERDVVLQSARADYSQKNWPVTAAIDGNARKGWAIGGGFFKDHFATFTTRKPVGGSGGTTLTFTLDQNFGRGRTIGRFRISAFLGDPTALEVPDNIARLLRKKSRQPRESKRLEAYYLKNHATATQLDNQVRGIRRQLAKLKPDTTLVMVEQAAARKTHVLKRGDYLAPGDAVTAQTPKALNNWRDEWPRNRLGLARWLTDRDNPLVARVAVNRWWSQIFGHGIVTTEEDFGTRGAKPTHPGLLDWLATEFMDSNWSMKHTLGLIVTSATYRQSSRIRAGDADAKNMLYGRGPRFRMSAEMIRDSGLAVSGLLSTKTGGKPVFPPQPPGLWRQTGRNEPKYIVATDHNRFRRGIYVVWRRAAPYPSFVLFDGPDRSECHPKRSRTNTPMQALALMNDEAFVEMAMALAQRIVTDGGATTAERVEYGFRRVLARRPTSREADHLANVFRRELRRLNADPKVAKTLVDGMKGLRFDPEADRVRLAAWFFVANILFNLDEAITKG